MILAHIGSCRSWAPNELRFFNRLLPGSASVLVRSLAQLAAAAAAPDCVPYVDPARAASISLHKSASRSA